MCDETSPAHGSRLNRDLTGRFGSATYAFEELVADMGAAFLGQRLGLRPDHTPPKSGRSGLQTKEPEMSDIEITKSSGNVFADLGLPDADTHFVKAKLVSNILDIMRDQGLTQTKAAELMGITQPKILGSATVIFGMSRQSG